MDEEDHVSDDRRYRAPALEKGLDILELLAFENAPLTVSAISQKLGRSMSELFRMVQVLEFRGFIEQSGNDGYVPTDRLFALGMSQPPRKTLLETALPLMRQLTSITGQSCHLAMQTRGDIVVVARIESSEKIGFSVRVGYRESIALTRSGAVLFAFQDDDVRASWLADLSPDINEEQIARLRNNSDKIRKMGYDKAKSDFTVGVTDISAPILRGHVAAAALTVPFMHTIRLKMPIELVIKHLRATAAEISASLHISDHRV